ncbi:Chitin binding domain [Trinorchestia longiramus]|nr:Chitin binding domain [Trinorchestia longiramus]
MKGFRLLLILQLLLLPLIWTVTSHNAEGERLKELKEFKPFKLASIKYFKRRTGEAATTPIQTAVKSAIGMNKSRHLRSLKIVNNSRQKRKIIQHNKPKSGATSPSKATASKTRPRLLRRVTKIRPLGKRQIVSSSTSTMPDMSTTMSDDQALLNRTYKAELMKQRYFRFRSLLPGGDINKEAHTSDEDLSTSIVPDAGSSSLLTPLQDIGRGTIHRIPGIILKEQRSADENTGSTISGQLKKFQHPFVPSDVHLKLNSDSNPSPERLLSNSIVRTGSVESITRLLAKRLGPSARNTYDPSILVDFLALVALNRQPTNIRHAPDEIPSILISSRRRGGDLTRRLSQRRASFSVSQAGTHNVPLSQASRALAKELGPHSASVTHQHDRATSSLEAPLLFSTSDLSTQNESASAQDSAQSTQRENVNIASSTATETLLNPTNRVKGSNEFGPFSDGNDPSAGVSPPALPPVLKASLYNYLVPRLMYLAPLTETIPGVPGLDYPIMSTVPYTNFYCTNMPWPGFYADTEARCQAWHMCDLDGRQASFLCPNGTIFNQAFMVSPCPCVPSLVQRAHHSTHCTVLPTTAHTHTTVLPTTAHTHYYAAHHSTHTLLCCPPQHTLLCCTQPHIYTLLLTHPPHLQAVCDWWYNSDCQAAPYLYPLNERLFQQPELPPPTQHHRTLTAQVLDTLFLCSPPCSCEVLDTTQRSPYHSYCYNSVMRSGPGCAE